MQGNYLTIHICAQPKENEEQRNPNWKICMSDTTASCRSICSSVGITLRAIVIHSCPQKHFVKGMTIGVAKG